MTNITTPAKSAASPRAFAAGNFRTTAVEAHQEKQKPKNHKRIGAAAVRELCGGISDMSLWRWLDNEDLNFPRPIYIARRRYWREADVIKWLDRQAETTS